MANSGSLNLENLIDPEDLFRISGEDSFIEDNDNDPDGKDKTEPDGDKKDTHQVIDGGDGSGLFDPQESVDDKDDKKTGEGSDPDGHGSSPNIYSSIAKDFKEEGVFPDLEDEEIEKLTSAELFSDMLNRQIEKRLDDTQKRVLDALNAGVEPSQIQQYESMIKYLDTIDEDDITSESDDAVKLRQNLIYRDLINRGYSEERAKRAVKKSFDNGNDVDDAKDALEGNREFFKKAYNDVVKEAQAEKDKEIRERQQEMDKVKNSILNGDAVVGNFVVPQNMRQKVFDSISRPVYKDPDTGEMLTAVQKYAADNHYEFLKIMGVMYTMTDGFKNIDNLIKGEVNKTTKKSLKNLTDALNGTTRNSDGSFRLANGLGGDKDTYSGSDDWTLDV